MKILVISTNIFTVPLSGYGGLEQIAWDQANGLGLLGHDVTLVAPAGSSTPHNGKLIATVQGQPERDSWLGYKDRLGDFDCIVSNEWEKWSYISKMQGLKTPVIGVCHAPPNTMYATPPRQVAKPCFVGLSKDHAKFAEECWQVRIEVAYNGIDTSRYPMDRTPNDRYLFLARMSTIKGPDIAIAAADRAGVGLDLVGDDTITSEPGYADIVKNFNDGGRIRYVGPQTRQQCAAWFATAKALLHPIQRYREPFGMTIVEAGLCGCPVIAWRNGSMSELVKHGETGYLVDSLDEMVSLMKSDAVAKIDPTACREHALQFSAERMAKRYEELCLKAVAGGW